MFQVRPDEALSSVSCGVQAGGQLHPGRGCISWRPGTAVARQLGRDAVGFVLPFVISSFALMIGNW